ncbi:MAG: folate family ECF transporter S component [Candidatus Bruticola sp.]
MPASRTAKITYMAAFIAITLTLRALPAPPIMHGFFRFVAFPIILSGFILGAEAGFWVGAISDILGWAIFPSGPYFPGFTITQGLTGYIPAKLFGTNNISWQKILAAVATGQIITKFFLVPIFQHILFQPTESWLTTWQLISWASLPAQLFHIPVYTWLIIWSLHCLAPLRTIATVNQPHKTDIK